MKVEDKIIDWIENFKYEDLSERDIDIIKKQKTTYETIEDVPEWAKPTIRKLMGKDILRGEGNGLGLTYDLTRVLVINDRAGLYD